MGVQHQISLREYQNIDTQIYRYDIPGSKWKYGRHINVIETTSTGKSIAITPEAFKNQNYETSFYDEY